MDPLIPLGQPAPLFSLTSLDGVLYHLEEWQGKVLILNFWSSECPLVERTDRELLSYLPRWGQGIDLWAIASNADEKDNLMEVIAQRGLPLVLNDPQQQVADLYGAVTTPHLFVLDSHKIVRYQGATDDATVRQRTPTRFYLRQAVEALLAGRDPKPAQTPPYGCAITRHRPLKEPLVG